MFLRLHSLLTTLTLKCLNEKESSAFTSQPVAPSDAPPFPQRGRFSFFFLRLQLSNRPRSHRVEKRLKVPCGVQKFEHEELTRAD